MLMTVTGLTVNKLSGWLYVDNLLNRVAFVGFDHSEAQDTPQFVRAIPTVPRTIRLDFQFKL